MSTNESNEKPKEGLAWVQRALYLNQALPDMALLYLANPTAGVLQGDHFKVRMKVAPGAKAHLFLCMLAYYLQRAMEQALVPLLFADESPPEWPDPVAPAPRSNGAKRREATKKTTDGLPVHSFRTLLAHLGTMVKKRLILKGAPEAPGFDQVTLPTQLQARAFELLQLPINPL